MNRSVASACAFFVLAFVLGSNGAASASPLRTARIGDPMTALVQGLTTFDGGVIGRCGDAEVRYTGYVVPGRPLDEDDASFMALSVHQRLVIIVSFDEEDLSRPTSVYADTQGQGNITKLWAVKEAPHPCTIIEELQRTSLMAERRPGY